MNALSKTAKLQVLHFLLKNVRICAELKYIDKVLLLPLLETIPTSPNYVTGLMNIAGKSIPVIDLTLRLGLIRDQPYSLDTPILLCSKKANQVGIIVDKIIQLDEIEESAIQMRQSFSEDNSPFIASISLNTELSLLIDMEQILEINMTGQKNNFKLDPKLMQLTEPDYE